jgi:hypothetical protein
VLIDDGKVRFRGKERTGVASNLVAMTLVRRIAELKML